MTERNLEQWLAYLEQLHPSAIDMGLERSRQVLERMGLAKPAPLVITVTGTNGKGSTCAFIASLLRAQGLKVGVYSSPHLLRYNERVSIDGAEASDQALCRAFEAIEQARAEISLTYFEVGTLAAFWLFQQAALDAVVLEVGLGGRLDAVNLVDADIALITSIGLDHAEYLGTTRESVAFEKAGIMRAGKPALCGDLDPPQTLLNEVARLDVPFLLRGRDFDLHVGQDSWRWSGLNAQGQVVTLDELPLLDLPMENAALALQALAQLDIAWQPESIVKALQATQVVGRLDRRSITVGGKCINLLLDVGHNPHAAVYLAQRLEMRPVNRRLAVFGLLADKDLAGVVGPLQLSFSQWQAVTLDTPRARPGSELAEYLRGAALPVTEQSSVAQALDTLSAQAQEGDEIVVFGSFFCVAEALAWMALQA